MSNLTLTAQWHDTINQVETSEPITGGAEGNANLATKQLAESLLWLKQQFETKKNESYKVGDVYVTTIDHADAAAVKAHHGYGTWVRYAEGQLLLGIGSHTDKNGVTKNISMMQQLGEYEHQLTIDEMPSHKHTVADTAGTSGKGGGWDLNGSTDNFVESNGMGLTGGNRPHNNIQPSIGVGMWLRTA